MRNFLLNSFVFCSMLLSLTLSQTVSATPKKKGVITNILSGPVYGDKLFIQLTGAMENKPNCHNNGNYSFVVDTSTDSGKAYMSLVLMAFASARQVDITGFDGCSIYSGVTNFRSISIK